MYLEQNNKPGMKLFIEQPKNIYMDSELLNELIKEERKAMEKLMELHIECINLRDLSAQDEQDLAQLHDEFYNILNSRIASKVRKHFGEDIKI